MTETLVMLRPGPYLEVRDVRRIALLQALHLGDFLCAVPAMRAVKGRYPEAEITLIGLPWVRSILDRYPYLDRFSEFPGYSGLEGIPDDPTGTEAFLQEARGYGYDLAIQMHGDGRLSNAFVAQLGARASLGYRPDGPDHPAVLDLELVDASEDSQVARWLRLVNVLEARGVPELEFPLTAEDWVEAESVARGAGIAVSRPMIGVHPGGKDPARRWPAELFAEVADRLAGELNAQVVVTGTLDELELARRVAAGVRSDVFVVAGRTSVGGLGALLAQMPLVVTNDTGPSHLAAAVGAPSVTLFGPTEPARWAPPNSKTHVALWSGPGEPVSSIPVERVVEESLALVERCASPTF